MRARLATAAVLVLLAAGCQDESPPSRPNAASDRSGTDSPSATSSPAAEPSTPAFPADSGADDGGYGTGGPRWITAVRTGHHDGYDRVVIELGGSGTPGWYVTYTDDPRADGSGEPVQVDGDVFLQVGLRGMGYPGLDGVPETAAGSDRTPGAGAVTEFVPSGVFEGDLLGFAGLTGEQRPFRVFALSDPTRVVLDVRNG